MNQFLATLKLVVSILPTIIEIIKSVEEAIPGKGIGEQKLELLRNILESTYNLSGELTLKFDDVWNVVKSLTSVLVSIFNKTKVFSN